MSENIKAIVEHYLAQRIIKINFSASLGPDTAVFDNGLIDSLAMVELITEIEKQTGREADILLLDPSQINTLNELISQLEHVFAG